MSVLVTNKLEPPSSAFTFQNGRLTVFWKFISLLTRRILVRLFCITLSKKSQVLILLASVNGLSSMQLLSEVTLKKVHKRRKEFWFSVLQEILVLPLYVFLLRRRLTL